MKTAVTIRFTSGREERFEMELWGGSGPRHACRHLWRNRLCCFEAWTKVLVIPGSAIECISLKIPKGDSRFNLSEIRPATRIK
jgi:hypothetical protein